MKPRLFPVRSLDAIYGEKLAFCPRPTPGFCHWLPQDPLTLEMLTGGMLTVSGNMPVVCAASVATPAGLQLLRDAGFPEPRTLLYKNTAEHERLCAILLDRGFRLALQHAPCPAQKNSEKYWIDPDVLRLLNNKGRLSDFVDPPYLPERRVMPPAQLCRSPFIRNLPVVIKVATCETTGGGRDIRICRTPKEVRQAWNDFRHCSQIVVEAFLSICRNLCLNYAIAEKGEITYLGSSEQIVDQRGIYYGNWLETTDPAPAAAIDAGKRIAKKGRDMGYHGCVGMDMAILKDGGIRIYDLNFRLNGSTPALLLASEIRRNFCYPMMRLAGIRCGKGFTAMIEAIYRAMHKRMFVPLVTCDPRYTGMPEAPARASGLILARNRAQAQEYCAQLQAMGLEVMSPGNSSSLQTY